MNFGYIRWGAESEEDKARVHEIFKDMRIRKLTLFEDAPGEQKKLLELLDDYVMAGDDITFCSPTCHASSLDEFLYIALKLEVIEVSWQSLSNSLVPPLISSRGFKWGDLRKLFDAFKAIEPKECVQTPVLSPPRVQHLLPLKRLNSEKPRKKHVYLRAPEIMRLRKVATEERGVSSVVPMSSYTITCLAKQFNVSNATVLKYITSEGNFTRAALKTVNEYKEKKV